MIGQRRCALLRRGNPSSPVSRPGRWCRAEAGTMSPCVTCDMSRLHSAPALKGARLKHQMRAIVLTGQTTPSEALFEALCSSVC